MENEGIAAGGRRPDPEVQAGWALRRLRLSRNWSQEEVAARMTAYGYDFHQTTIAKIEAAQRPLRVRELADFAALYGVNVQDLVYPPPASLPKTDEDIAEVTARRDRAQAQAAQARDQLEAARHAMYHAETAYQAAAAEAAVLDGRLASLLADKQNLVSGKPAEGLAHAEGRDVTGRDASEPKRTPIVAATGDPTILRILLGSQLRRMREAKGITREEAGYAIRASGAKVARLELGRVGFKDRDVAELLTLYGVTDEHERQSLRALARRANSPGWWHDYADILPGWFESYVGLEQAAAQIRAYEVQFVPGLLQTEDYARAVALLGHPDVPAREVERRVRLRMARQEVLARPDPSGLLVVLDEAVLRRHIGGPAVMHDQIQHLAEMAERPTVTIQVLPFQASSNPAGGPFSILQFAEPDLPDVVYLEQLTSALYLDDPQVVSSYREVMQLLADQALTPRKTTQFLKQLLKEPLLA